MVVGAWSLEPGHWRMDHLDLVASAWSLENGCWSLELARGAGHWSLEPGACDSDVTGSTLISLKYFYFPLHRCIGNEPYFTS